MKIEDNNPGVMDWDKDLRSWLFSYLIRRNLLTRAPSDKQGLCAILELLMHGQMHIICELHSYVTCTSTAAASRKRTLCWDMRLINVS